MIPGKEVPKMIEKSQEEIEDSLACFNYRIFPKD